jgi:UDP-GlcNAc:undecaprenyl-phosphate/decaprenyl-phosphate GlcNAc-1-phosphate transferase
MGDCGSLFLGFFLGGISLINNEPGLRRNVVTILTVPVLLLLIPIVDTTLVTINRKLHGRPISQGGRDHTSHRLVALGLSERTAALILWAAAVISGGLAVLIQNLSWAVALVLVPSFAVIVLFFFVHLGRVRVYEPAETNPGLPAPSRALLPTLADFTYKRRIFEVLHDLVIIALCYYGAFLLRFDDELVQPYYRDFLWSLPIVMCVQLAAFLGFGLYRGMWRYTSLSDIGSLGGAVAGGWVASIVAILFLLRSRTFSRGVLIIDGLLLALVILGSRMSFRLLRLWLGNLRKLPDGRRVLICGAGDGGELLLREIHNNQSLGLQPVGFLDDDLSKQGRVIHGVRVLGTIDALPSVVEEIHAQEVIVATSKLSDDRSTEVSVLCQQAGVALRRMRIALE